MTVHVWVGLQYREGPDVFEWANGRNMTSSQMSDLFTGTLTDEPDGSGNWVSRHRTFDQLVDRGCDNVYYNYVCEMLMPG